MDDPITKWIQIFRLTTSAAKDKPRRRIRSENAERIRTVVLRSLKCSAVRHSLAMNISDLILKELRFHSNKIKVI